MNDEEIDDKIEQHSLNSITVPEGYIVLDLHLANAILGEWRAGEFDEDHWIARTFVGLIQVAGG